MALKQSATRYKQKNKYFSLSDHQLAENLILAIGFKKEQNEDKSELLTKSTIIFM